MPLLVLLSPLTLRPARARRQVAAGAGHAGARPGRVRDDGQRAVLHARRRVPLLDHALADQQDRGPGRAQLLLPRAAGALPARCPPALGDSAGTGSLMGSSEVSSGNSAGELCRGTLKSNWGLRWDWSLMGSTV